MSALRRADCWTDHRLLRGKLFLANACHASRQPIRKRFAVHKLSDDSTRHAFVEGTLVKIKSQWSENMPAGKMWAVLKDGILESGRTILGTDGRRQPDWFRDNSEILKPLLSLRNALFARWLESQCHQDRQRYVAKRRAVARTVRTIKNDWFQQKVKEVELRILRGDSGGAWRSIRDIQRVRGGLLPTKPSTIRNSDGVLCSSSTECVRRWREHFDRVFNASGQFFQGTIDSFPSYDVCDDMAIVPAMEEVRTALSHLTGNRAGGSSGILPEMVKVCSNELLEYLVKLFTHVWNSGSVPQDWRDALLIPVPKKGDLSLCDNWRGISLLEVVGKVFAKIIQRRLQVLVEDVVADSQCGFDQVMAVLIWSSVLVN